MITSYLHGFTVSALKNLQYTFEFDEYTAIVGNFSEVAQL